LDTVVVVGELQNIHFRRRCVPRVHFAFSTKQLDNKQLVAARLPRLPRTPVFSHFVCVVVAVTA